MTNSRYGRTGSIERQQGGSFKLENGQCLYASSAILTCGINHHYTLPHKCCDPQTDKIKQPPILLDSGFHFLSSFYEKRRSIPFLLLQHSTSMRAAAYLLHTLYAFRIAALAVKSAVAFCIFTRACATLLFAFAEASAV